MAVTRKRIAQACTAVAAAAMFLPWHTTVGEGGTESVRGTDVDEGQIVLVVCLVTIGLIQVGWRPAWIGAGFAAAITIREMLDLFGASGNDPASGLWIAVGACAIAIVLLVWDMFAGVAAGGDTGAGDGEPDKPGLSGRLGRRR